MVLIHGNNDLNAMRFSLKFVGTSNALLGNTTTPTRQFYENLRLTMQHVARAGDPNFTKKVCFFFGMMFVVGNPNMD